MSRRCDATCQAARRRGGWLWLGLLAVSMAGACAHLSPADREQHTGWVLSLYVPAQEVPQRELGLPDDVSVGLGDLWVSIEGIAYPLVTVRPGVLAVVSPTLLETAPRRVSSAPTILDRALHFGVYKREFLRTSQPTTHYATFELLLIVSPALAARLGRTDRFLATGLFTVQVDVHPDRCYEGPPERVMMQKNRCFYDGNETDPERCRLRLPIKRDGRIRLGPLVVHVAVDGGGPCVETLRAEK
jgi:hypothetical protein